MPIKKIIDREAGESLLEVSQENSVTPTTHVVTLRWQQKI